MTNPVIRRGDLWWVSLDPTRGSEIRKTRPCLVLSHDTLNKLRRTVVVIPLSTQARPYPPVTVSVTCRKQQAVAIVDQIRAVTKGRMKSRIESLPPDELSEVCKAVSSILELA